MVTGRQVSTVKASPRHASLKNGVYYRKRMGNYYAAGSRYHPTLAIFEYMQEQAKNLTNWVSEIHTGIYPHLVCYFTSHPNGACVNTSLNSAHTAHLKTTTARRSTILQHGDPRQYRLPPRGPRGRPHAPSRCREMPQNTFCAILQLHQFSVLLVRRHGSRKLFD